ncbi:DEAD/DEAH box helicase [Isoptericola haloaureus]|uniref:DEAD/DEAH box helicase n=1 Tax=Isoptericola haloaureus TaxID=1542902 RepID=A0ABU7Z874_9MICO
MKLRDLLRRAPATRPDPTSGPVPTFDVEHGDVTTFTTSPERIAALFDGEAHVSITEQFLVLDALADEGRARATDRGFEVTADDLARLDPDEARILGLPARFTGRLGTAITGTTARPDFSVDLAVRLDKYDEAYRRDGVLLTVGMPPYEQTFRLSPPTLRALRGVERHAAVPVGSRSETHNIRLVAELQGAQRMAAADDPAVADPDFSLTLHHFDRFTTVEPGKVGVAVAPQPDGSLRLTPHLGDGLHPDDLDARWHQLPSDGDAGGGVLRVDKDLVLLERDQLEGVHEVQRQGSIPKEQVPQFLEAPGSFLDHEKVDIELTFAWLVAGLGRIAPVSFAQAAQQGPQWISEDHGTTAPDVLVDRPQSLAEHEEISEQIDEAWERGADVVPLGDDLVDVSDRDRVRECQQKARQRLEDLGVTPGHDEESDEPAPSADGPQVQVGWELDDATELADHLRAAAESARLHRPVDHRPLQFSPFPHQVEGIEWMTRLMQASLDGADHDPGRIRGALLADDMGLGKTFMTLAALGETVRSEQEHGGPLRPHLAVMPVALLENWLREIESVFGSRTGPFDEVVVLQGAGVAPFRTGKGKESAVAEDQLDHRGMVRDDVLADLMLLRVGDQFGDARLDRPGTLVLTTYDTVSRYQVSLSQADWGVVVFDEAQNVKNPDILRTRAAKALRARFKLAATGTPVENSLRDFWSMLDLVQPGLLGTWAQFRDRWEAPMNEAPSERKAELGRALRDAVGPFMLRRVKEDHLSDLPTKHVHDGGEHAAPMPAVQRQAYDDAVARYRAGAGKKGAMLGALHDLGQVCLHPGLVHDDLLETAAPLTHSARTAMAVTPILDGIRAVDEKAIVFVRTKAMQRALASWLRERYGVPVDVVNGDTPATGSDDSRVKRIRRFEARPGFGVIIMSPLAVGVGLTVVGANHAIHLERHWNPAKEAQATDRIYRIGQTRDVHVYYPMALHPDVDSFDVNLERLLRSKVSLSGAVVVPEQVSEEEVARAMGLS